MAEMTPNLVDFIKNMQEFLHNYAYGDANENVTKIVEFSNTFDSLSPSDKRVVFMWLIGEAHRRVESGT